jgi:hypothetical protein
MMGVVAFVIVNNLSCLFFINLGKNDRKEFFCIFVDFIEYLVINIFFGFFLFGAFSSHPEGY